MSGFKMLKNDEKIVFGLRELYAEFGYSQYKMNKFEEYDLYVRNKDFLISENVITFTDTNGKLMALKPDVTLSIVKNSKDEAGCVSKVYYNENVYRVSDRTHAFRELMQVGLECIGDIDDYCLCEVISLAAKSLEYISPDYILDISHLGIISYIIDALGVEGSDRDSIIHCIGEKNLHDLSSICESLSVDANMAELLRRVVSLYGTVDSILPELEKVAADYPHMTAAWQFIKICRALAAFGVGDRLHIDFSVVNDIHYYNGLVFKGFINGVPDSVLSGGQYDKLMKKMGRRSGAIGFAVYLDTLERLNDSADRFDVDTVLLYDGTSDLDQISRAVKALTASGKSVTAQRGIPEKLRCREVLILKNGEVATLENNA